MYELPTSVSIKGQSFAIRNSGDYRMVLDCFQALNDTELNEQERILASLVIFYDCINDIEDLDKLPDMNEAAEQMCLFFNYGQKDEIELPNKPKLIDWEKDSMIICSAINNVARTEVRALPYLHWWTFMGYYMAINESFLSNIINIRHKIATNKKLEKHEREFKRENPQYFIWDSRTAEQKEAEDYVMNLWNNNSNKTD